MGSSGSEVVGHLNRAHHREIAYQHLQDNMLEVVLLYEAELVQAEKPYHEVQLMARPVVYPAVVAKGLGEIGRDFLNTIGVADAKIAVPLGSRVLNEIKKASKGFVPKSTPTLFVWRTKRNKTLHLVQQRQYDLHVSTRVVVAD